MFHVKNMSLEDLEFAIRITDTMNWNLVEKDFKFMMQLEPKGCFVLLSNSEKVGIATTISFDRLGWIGNVIVSESYRKQGAGSLLVRHCVKYLTSKNVETVGLYSYMDKIPFYKRLGFEYNTEFAFLKGKGFSSPIKAGLKKATKEDIDNITDYDHSGFGALRRKLLEPILLDPNNLCYISIEDGQISGYIAAKVYEKIAEIGPMVCRRVCNDIAINLLRAILNRLEGFGVSMYVPKNEHAILNMLMDAGFSENLHVARMFFGPPVVKDCIYMAESAERG
jgi:GNAT superfamily N-acetyltransferase